MRSVTGTEVNPISSKNMANLRYQNKGGVAKEVPRESWRGRIQGIERLSMVELPTVSKVPFPSQ
jgi:hypothetical protein